MRNALILVGLVLLGGCNVVVSKAPLLTAADEAGAAGLVLERPDLTAP